jgi:hypothetical protein
MPTTPSRSVTLYTFQFVPNPQVRNANGSALITFREPVGAAAGSPPLVIDFNSEYTLGAVNPLRLFGFYPNFMANKGALTFLEWNATTISGLNLAFVNDDGVQFSVTESEILSTVAGITGSWAFLEKYTVNGPIIKGPAL